MRKLKIILLIPPVKEMAIGALPLCFICPHGPLDLSG